MLALLLSAAGCSDDTATQEAGPGADISLDSAAYVDSSSLPDGYGPLYDCTRPGESCNAHDPCAINPICGKDKKCRPSYLQDCGDALSCTEDKCVGQGMCSNDPKTGYCVLGVKVATTGGGAAADGGAATDKGSVDAHVPTKTIFKCFKQGERNPNDPCLMCSPKVSDGGVTTNNKKWSAANGGSCDDGKSCTKNDYCQSGICKGSYFGDQCSDGYGCTDDLCDGKGGCLGNKLKSDWCLINGACYKENASHPQGSCFTCDPKQSQSAWTAITNTCMIGSKCYNKGAKNPGGCGECDPAVSTSKWTVKGITCCLINDKSYNAGTKDTTGCSTCDPTKDKYGWTAVPGLCKINSKCYAKGAKHTGGCAECDPVISATKWTVKAAGLCLISDKCYTDGTVDSTGCATCDSKKDKYGWTPTTGKCKINGKCYTKGTKHSGGCAECAPATNATAWTVTGSTSCLINNICYKAGDKVGCYKCDPAKSKTSWTKVSGCTGPPLVLNEVNIGLNDYIAIKNVSSSPINLKGYTIGFDDTRGTTTTYDFTYTFSTKSIKGGATLYVCESSSCSGNNSVNVGKNIMYDPSGGGATYLCQGKCGTGTVLDVHSWKGTGSAATLLFSTTFTPGPSTGITSSNESTHSFLRQALAGKHPTFVQSDWKVGKKTK